MALPQITVEAGETGETQVIRLRLTATHPNQLGTPFDAFEQVLTTRQQKADEFYDSVTPPSVKADVDRTNVMRQALAGMLWSKQYFYYDVEKWYTDDVISMPDKWEYPWFAAWDLAFHMIPLSIVDPDFAKRQLELMLQEDYMHPKGQMPAYKWNFGM